MKERFILPLFFSAFAFSIIFYLSSYVIAWPHELVRVTWKPEYAQVDPIIRDWYESAQLTPEASTRLGFKSCCAHADIVHTRFRVSTVDGADQWQWLNNGNWKTIPADIIEIGHSPNGQPTLFVVGEMEVCFFTPDGGI